MKNNKIHITSLLFLLTVICFSCEKEDEWSQINALETEGSLAAELNSIFSEENYCLIMTSDKSQMQAIFSSGNFQTLDSCNQVPEIDFANSTLIVGRIEVLSISDKIESVNLSLLDNKYRVEISIDKCAECYAATGYKYFWKLFPKLELGYDYELIVK